MAAAPLTPVAQARCFQEDPTASLWRRSLAEGIGTMMLMIAVTGSTLHVTPASLGPAVATGGSLTGLILAFGTLSGGHFNPTITIVQWLLHDRRLNCMLAYVCAQMAGALAGSLITALMFERPLVGPTSELPDIASVLSEGVASFGLMTIVFCCARSTSKFVGPFAVGLWLIAAILSTPTGSIANPAVAVGLLAAPGGGSSYSVAAFVIAQLIGGGVASWTVSLIYQTGDAASSLARAARPNQAAHGSRPSGG